MGALTLLEAWWGSDKFWKRAPAGFVKVLFEMGIAYLAIYLLKSLVVFVGGVDLFPNIAFPAIGVVETLGFAGVFNAIYCSFIEKAPTEPAGDE